ncbi:unnamed protein product [Choristocarpus tenellus]
METTRNRMNLFGSDGCRRIAPKSNTAGWGMQEASLRAAERWDLMLLWEDRVSIWATKQTMDYFNLIFPWDKIDEVVAVMITNLRSSLCPASVSDIYCPCWVDCLQMIVAKSVDEKTI